MTNLAVIVGYSGYRYFEPLDGVVTTADCFEKMLSYRFNGEGVFDAVEKIIDYEPADVNEKLDEIFLQAGSQDRVSLILIGHGKVWNDDSPSLKLASHLARPDAENEAHWLTVGNLANKLETAASADRLMLLDCCGAGYFDLESLDPSNGPGSATAAQPMDGSLENNALAMQIKSKKIRAPLSGRDGRVATIVTTASDKAAWLGGLRPPKELQSLFDLALGSSPFINPDAQHKPTYFCQSVAVCHFIASNYADLRHDRDRLNPEEQALIREISRLMQPDNAGRFWANDVTQASAHLLKRIESSQEPRFNHPKTGKSYMALVRVAGPSRRERLVALRERMERYPNVSDASRKSVLDQIGNLARTRARDRSSKMKALESALLGVPDGSEYLVVETVLKDGIAFALAEETQAFRDELEKEFDAEITARKKELGQYKTEVDKLSKSLSDAEKSLSDAEKKVGLFRTALVAACIPWIIYLVNISGFFD